MLQLLHLLSAEDYKSLQIIMGHVMVKVANRENFVECILFREKSTVAIM